jgi:(p)ppGpp synthase/HD superfamily hydrolase
MTIVSEDGEGQIDRVQEVMAKYNIKVTNLNIKRDFQKKEITLGFRLRLRAVRPDRNILKEVFGIPGIKRVDLQ